MNPLPIIQISGRTYYLDILSDDDRKELTEALRRANNAFAMYVTRLSRLSETKPTCPPN